MDPVLMNNIESFLGNNTHHVTTVAGASPMRLNNETLEAIKNRKYQLRPVRMMAPQKKRRMSTSDCDLGQILSRRSCRI